MSKKLKKVRIYQEPDYTASSGYLLADAGEGQSTGKITFADLGNLIRSNPLVIVFQRDQQSGNIMPYRLLSFDMGAQPKYEQIDFKWMYDHSYELMGCPSILWYSTEYIGNPIFFMAGMYNDPQTYLPYFEFTRFDTTDDQLVTEHSIIVTTDGSYPLDTGNTICSERRVTINSQQIQFIVSNSTASAGPSVYQQCETYAANTADWKRVHPLVFVDTGYSLQYNQYYNYAGKYNNYHQFYRVTPASLGSPGSTINVEIDTLRVSSSTIWHASANIATQEWVSNNYVVKVTGKGLSTNDYTAADKAVVDLASSSIPSSASSSNMLMTRTDVDTIVSKIGGYKKVPLDTSGYPDVQDPSVKLIYLTPAADASAANYYDEWLYDSASPVSWEKIGNTQIDLDGYATEDYVDSHTSDYITSAYLGPYAKIVDVQTSIDQATSGKMDKSQSADFYPMATNPSGYLIDQDLNGYATETYVQNYTSAFITSADVPSGVQYSAGENIDISGNVISVTDKSQLLPGQNIAITPSGNDFVISSTVGTIVYSAGRYVDIDNFVINVTGLQPSGSYLTSADLNGYATEQYVTDHTSAFITSAYLNDYVKTSALNDLSDTLTDFTDEFTSDLDDLSGAIDDANEDLGDLSAAIDNKLDKSESANYYPRYSNPEEYLTSADLGEYAKTREVEDLLDETSAWANKTFQPSGAYVTSAGLDGVLSSYMTTSDIETAFGETSAWAETTFASASQLSSYATTQDLQSGLSGKLDNAYSANFYPMATNPSGYITSGQVAQSDWTELSSASPAYIKNKPTHMSLVGGNGIDVSEVDSAIVISVSASYAMASGLDYVSGAVDRAFDDLNYISGAFNDYATEQYVQSATSGKVDKISGYGLSKNDFTDAYLDKLNSIASGAEVNVQSDWNVTNSALDSYIANKPGILNLVGRDGIEVSVASSSVIVSVSASYATTQELSGKLDKSASADFYPMATNPSGYITSSQVTQSDWNEADSGALDYIKNKPSIIISQDSPAALGGISAPKYLMVVTSMPAAADIDPDTIYLVQGTYIGT